MTDDEMDMMPPAIRRGTQRHFFDGPGRADDAAVLAKLEVDYTPAAVAVQLLLALNELAEIGGDPGRCLCPSAGSGVWARAMRAAFGQAPVIVGVDARESERANLEAACDVAIIGDVTKPDTLGDFDNFGLVADNPPFSAFSSFWPGRLLDSGCLASDAVVAFYGLSSWGQSADAAPHLARWSPSLQIRVGGRIAHRGGPAADAREYSLWVWYSVSGRPVGVDRRAGTLSRWPEWRTVQTAVMPAPLRCWDPSSVPGTFPIDPALVAEIRARYL